MTDGMISFGAKLKQHAERQGDKPAVTCGADSLTYGQLHRLSNRVARGLAAKGVKAGDLVTVGLPNSIGFVAACYGIWKLGATPQPVSFRLPAAELQAIIDLAKAPLVVALFEHDVSREVVTAEALAALSDDESDLPDAIPAVSKAPTSGGSTGRPKLILAGQPGLSPEETPDVGGFRLRPVDTVLIPAPLYHNAPFGMTMSATQLGAHVVLTPRFDAEGVLAEVERRKAPGCTWSPP